MSNPATVPEPDVGRLRPHSMRMAVVLPAPSGPMRPNMEPSGTENVTSCNAWVFP